MKITKKVVVATMGVLTAIFGAFGIVACEEQQPVQEQQHTHHYSETIVSPTCTEEGYTAYTCDCGETYKDNFVEAMGGEHDYVLESLEVAVSDIKNCGIYKCTVCSAEKRETVTCSDVGIPILSFDGDISGMSKENKVNVSLLYETENETIDCDATLKWQGASSLRYPKKNYTLQLLKKGTDSKNKVVLNAAWGKQSKYCLKANYIDVTHARNVVSGRIYSQIVHSRDIEDEVAELENGGVVDGFPVLIYINGGYQGLYTLNIPKDKWMLGMEDDETDDDVVTKQAILMADGWLGSASLKQPLTGDYASCSFELEFCSTEDTEGDAWVVESFNNMIEFINENDGEAFKAGIREYVNVERTIDSMLYTWIIAAADNVAKNILWVTYDGIHWNSSMYDMDGTWGLVWDGTLSDVSTFSDVRKSYFVESNVLWKKIYENFYEECKARYFELRKTVLSVENVEKEFLAFSESIPQIVLDSEKEKWQDMPSLETNTLTGIFKFIIERFPAIDQFLSK